jgi:hypothetical protein
MCTCGFDGFAKVMDKIIRITTDYLTLGSQALTAAPERVK